jgi:hypothetical protein
MKWNNYRESSVLFVNNSNTVMKADKAESLPNTFQICSFPKGYYIPENKAKIIHRGRYSGKYTNEEITCLMFESEGKKAVFNEKLVKPFLQKSSEFYLGNEDSPVLIKNKNYIVVIAPALNWELIHSMPLN